MSTRLRALANQKHFFFFCFAISLSLALSVSFYPTLTLAVDCLAIPTVLNAFQHVHACIFSKFINK